MINTFKRFVIVQLEFWSHIPGFKTYSRWMIKHYERNFWRTYLLNAVAGIALNLGIQWLTNWYLKRLENKNYQDLSWLTDRAAQSEPLDDDPLGTELQNWKVKS